MTKSDDWDFKVDVKESESVKEIKSSRQSLERREKPQAKLGIDQAAYVNRDERMKRFKAGVEDKPLDNLKVATIDQRVKATLIDSVFIALIYFAGTIYAQGYLENIIVDLNLNFLSSHYVTLALAYLIFHVLVSASLKQSVGMKIMKLRIGNSLDDYGASFMAIVWREAIVRPISILSIIGLLIALTNKQHRTLHDYLAGTIVYDES